MNKSGNACTQIFFFTLIMIKHFPFFFRAAMEEQPLVTSQYRELEKSKKMLNALSQYKRCVIKVQFPNQLVLQGTFTPLEKVSHVMDFVRKFMQDSTVDFHLCG